MQKLGKNLKLKSDCVTILFKIFRAVGGKDAEKDERLKWDNAERKKILDSVNCKI